MSVVYKYRVIIASLYWLIVSVHVRQESLRTIISGSAAHRWPPSPKQRTTTARLRERQLDPESSYVAITFRRKSVRF